MLSHLAFERVLIELLDTFAGWRMLYLGAQNTFICERRPARKLGFFVPAIYAGRGLIKYRKGIRPPPHSGFERPAPR